MPIVPEEGKTRCMNAVGTVQSKPIPGALTGTPWLEAGKSGKLLLVDSQEINRRLIKSMLRSAGNYEFFEAASGAAKKKKD